MLKIGRSSRERRAWRQGMWTGVFCAWLGFSITVIRARRNMRRTAS